MQPEKQPSKADSTSSYLRLYLNEAWYVKVNSQGFVLGSCAEGALGYIIQLYPGLNAAPDSRAALKLPRLRADTLEDNAYIAEVLKDEAKNVIEANTDAHPPGLIPIAHVNPDIMRGVRQLDNLIDDESIRQRGAVPFISFSYGHRLRICNVKFVEHKISIYPDSSELQQEFAGMTEEIWDSISGKKEAGGLSFVHFREAVFYAIPGSPLTFTINRANTDKAIIEVGNLVPAKRHGKLQPALSPSRPMRTWFAGVPSIVLKWANSTLQMAVSSGAHAKWTCQDHYIFLQSIIQGLVSLHRRGIIHGDVRPANIMALGALDEAERYALADYGSFSSDQAASSGGPQQATGMSTAPGIARHRASTFYARERRAGIEREDADVAVIISQKSLKSDSKSTLISQFSKEAQNAVESLPANEYFILLGWKKYLTKLESNDIEPQVVEKMIVKWIELIKNQPSITSQWGLSEGDQIRLRDYVFKVRAIQEEGGVAYIRADWNFCRILMERISVYSVVDLFELSQGESKSKDVLLLDLPSWVEIRQTSVASDLYSVGVMALYLFYAAALSDHGVRERMRQDSMAASALIADIELREIEHYLGAIVRRLEDENNFNHLWDNLNVVCSRIESAFRNHEKADVMLNQEYRKTAMGGGSEPEIILESTDISGKTNATPFTSEIEDLISTIVSTSPELRWILCYLNNAAHFLFFIEFVLACMHRKSHLQGAPSPDSQGVPALQNLTSAARSRLPFCNSRFERPTGSSAARDALLRLKNLIDYMNPVHEFFSDLARQLIVEDVHQVSIGDIQLRRELTKAQKYMRSFQDRIDEQELDRKSLLGRLNAEKAQSKKHLEQNNILTNASEAMTKQNRDLLSRLEQCYVLIEEIAERWPRPWPIEWISKCISRFLPRYSGLGSPALPTDLERKVTIAKNSKLIGPGTQSLPPVGSND